MGAETFYTYATGANAQEAFINAVEQARWFHGNGGYTGTIAEKDSFVMIDRPPEDRALEAYADELIAAADPRIDDKWGPAGCIDCGGSNLFYFFGWASS